MMRVRFVKTYQQAGAASYAAGAVVDLDEGVASELIAVGYAVEYPRTMEELMEHATKYYPDDEKRTEKQIAYRIAELNRMHGIEPPEDA